MAQLSHPNIVTVIDRGEQDGRQFIVFEYVEGENLKELVSRRGALPVREVIELGLQVGRALGFAHERGIVHRDVKPQNVILDEDGRAKVTDFGIARSLGVDGVTQTGTVLGTSDYIAPEQAQGLAGRRPDRRLLARRRPLRAADGRGALPRRELRRGGDAARERTCSRACFDRRPDCPPRLDLVVQRAMAKRPEHRHASMDELVAELQASLAELDGYGGDEAERTLVVPAARPAGWPAGATPEGPYAGRADRAGAPGAGGRRRRVPRSSTASRTGRTRTRLRRRRGPRELTAAVAFDPEGGDGEHDAEVPLATDGDPGTYWSTETYEDFRPQVRGRHRGRGRASRGARRAEGDDRQPGLPGQDPCERRSRRPVRGRVGRADGRAARRRSISTPTTGRSATTWSGCGSPTAGSRTSTR